MATSLGCAGSGMPPSVSHPLEGRAAPEFHEDDANGEGVVHVPVRGARQVTVVDFWATWCQSCRDTMPALDALSRDHADRGVTVVGVSLYEDEGQMRAFARHVGARFPLVFDPHQRIAVQWGVRRIPITFVLDEEGVVRWVGRDPETARRAVDALVGNERPPPRDVFAD
jgi:cytochrome c biogenesis protein CcmG/thiol:disulfide interchange protein DsbE